MVRSWSYLVVVLCVTVTSSRVLHRHGDELRSQGNHPSDVRLEKLTTPPTGTTEGDNGSKGDESICEELCRIGSGGNACMCDWPPFLSHFYEGYLTRGPMKKSAMYHQLSELTENICDTLCSIGNGGNACMCDWVP